MTWCWPLSRLVLRSAILGALLSLFGCQPTILPHDAQRTCRDVQRASPQAPVCESVALYVPTTPATYGDEGVQHFDAGDDRREIPPDDGILVGALGLQQPRTCSKY